MAILETNRGCPYGCTFCDWGSATQSRIRKFDLDRVFAELEWCATHKVHQVFLADANFGIFERDVEIAEKVAELKLEHGYPRAAVHQLRQEHHQAREEDRRVTGRRRDPHPRPALAAVDGHRDAEDGAPVEHQGREVRRSRSRVPRLPAPALRRPHARAPRGHPGVVRGRPPRLHRPRGDREDLSDRAPRQQPDERAGLPRRAPHPDGGPARRAREDRPLARRGGEALARDLHLELHEGRLRRDAPPAARVPHQRELRRAPTGLAVRAPGGGPHRGRPVRAAAPRCRGPGPTAGRSSTSPSG